MAATLDMKVLGIELAALGSLVQWLGPQTYPVVFLVALIDASGLPFPGRLLLIAAGALAGIRGESILPLIALAGVAAMLMDHVWYLAGAWGSERVLRFYQRLGGGAAQPLVGDDAPIDYFTRYGAATILLGRFFTSVRMLAWPVAAARGVGYGRFLVLDLVGAGLWASLWILLGWAAGERWQSAAETAGTWLVVTGALVVVAVAALLVIRRWRRGGRRRRARASAAPAPPR